MVAASTPCLWCPAPRFNGRSINLALSERGISGLRVVGLDEQVVESTIPMRARYVHNTGPSEAMPGGRGGGATFDAVAS